MRVRHMIYGVAIPTLLCLASCAKATPQPKLAVVLVVDQMRPDFLTRFADLYTGGFARIINEGRVFSNSYHDHAITFTGTGHATLATGCYPSSHGVIGNGWQDRSRNSYEYCCADSASKIFGKDDLSGRSPALMARPGLGDLLKSALPGAKVVSVALKDRSAIFLGGHDADCSVWYNWRTGEFVTSSYYYETCPQWLNDLNESGYVDQFAGSEWTRLLPESDYARSREDAFEFESDGEGTTFPHEFRFESDGSIDSTYYGDVYNSPFGDKMVLDVALLAAEAYELGQDSIPDLLILSCSAADWVGHSFGPFSQEVQDHFLRIDRFLDDFLVQLDSTVGRDNYVLALTSDHGVLPIPEFLAREGYPARRIKKDSVKPIIDLLIRDVEKEFNLDSTILFKSSNGYCLSLDSGVTDEIKLQVEARLAEQFRTLDFVEDVYTRTELEQQIGSERTYFNMYRNNSYLDRGPDLFVLEKEWIYWTSWKGGTSHGTPYTYDTHVASAFYGAGVQPGQVDDSVRTIDIAPTVYDMLGLGAMPGCDGVSLRPMLAD